MKSTAGAVSGVTIGARLMASTVTRTVSVADANDAPTVTADAASSDFNEGQLAPLSIVSNLAIGDVDGNTLSGVTIQLSGILDNTLGNPNSETIAIDPGSLPVGVTIDPPSGTGQTLTLSGNADITVYETILSGLTYFNGVDEPTTGERLVNITATDAGNPPRDGAFEISVQVNNINDRPGLDLDDGSGSNDSGATFTGAAVSIVNDTLLDGGSVDIFDGDDGFISRAVIEINDADLQAGDELRLSGAANRTGLTINGENTSVLEIVSNGPSATTDIQAFEALLAEVQFFTSSTSTATRNIMVSVFDESGPAQSMVRLSVITIGEIVPNGPEAALIDLDMAAAGTGSTTTFTEGAVSASLTGTVDVTDPGGGTTLMGAYVKVMDRPDGIWENVSLTPAGEFYASLNGIQMVDYDPTSGELNLVGEGTHEIYELLLQSLVYTNTSESPTGGMREVQIVINDGTMDSAPVMAMVDVEGEPASAGTPQPITLEFETVAGVRGYTEGGVEVQSLGEMAWNLLYLDDNNLDGSGDLLQIQNGGPYEFRMGGDAFDMTSIDVVQNFGTSTFTASNGATVTLPPGTGTFTFPDTFQDVTWVQWEVSVGLAVIDNVQITGVPVTNLTGTEGNDLLRSTAADEVMDGLGGHDTFEFDFGSGSDQVDGFQAGAGSFDVLDLSGRGFTSADQVMANATQDGADVVIDLGAGDEVRLTGIELAELHSDDFIV